MIVYVDIVFISNFVLDAALLLATAKVRNIRPSAWRIGCASAIGACYALLMFAPSLSAFYTFVVKCLFSAVMIMTAFGYKSLSRFFGTLLAFYGVSAVAAGTVMALHYALQSSNEVWNGIVFTQTGSFHYVIGVSLWFVIVAAGIGIALYRAVHAGAKRTETKARYLAEVLVIVDGESYRCTGLIDTGNHLYDPLTRTPVMVMEADVWKKQLPESWLAAIRSDEADRILDRLSDEGVTAEANGGEGGSVPLWRDRIRLVPYRGVNGHTRLMLAIKPDFVRIVQGDRHTDAKKVLIGVNGGRLSSDGAYQAIIHPALVAGTDDFAS